MRAVLYSTLALLLQAAWISAQSLESSYGELRSLVVPAKYKTVPEPGSALKCSDAKKPPPNLPMKSVVRLIERMNVIGKVRGKDTLSSDYVKQLVEPLEFADRCFVYPIPSRRWEGLLSEMGDVAEESFVSSNGNWDRIIVAMLKKAVTELKEPHSDFLDAGQAKHAFENIRGAVPGIGAEFLKNEGEAGAVVDIIYPDSPAALAGLREGDQIIGVEGAFIMYMSLNQVNDKINGEEGTQVRLDVLRGKGRAQPIIITRANIKTRNVFSKPDWLAEGVGYIHLRRFSEGVDQELFDLIMKLRQAGMKKLIFDLRYNLGGEVETASSIASEFLKQGQDIVTFKRGAEMVEKKITDGRDGLFADLPVLVLVNRYSASASEIVAGALKDFRPAPVIVGSRSYGKGSAQIVHLDQWGRAAQLTAHKWLTPSGHSLDAEYDPRTGKKIPNTGGVTVDVVVDLPQDQERQLGTQLYRELKGAAPKGPSVPDPVLERAVGIFRSRPAS